MLNKIPFTLFGNDDEIYFNNARIMQLEKAMDKSVITLIKEPLSLSFVMIGLQIGLMHTYKPSKVAEHINRLFDEGDASLAVLAAPLAKAILATGILGADLRDETIKNAVRTEKAKPSEASKNG